MLKVYDYAVTFSEFPDEVALCVNISNCPGMCSCCSEPWLLEDVGEELTNEKIDELVSKHPDITVFGLMGGDSDHSDVERIARHIHANHPKIKVGMYSGREFMSMRLLNCLDLYKIGRWIMPTGPVEEWHQTNNGVLQFPWSNQLYFERLGDMWYNATFKFRKERVGNPERYIVRPEDNKE